jgi:hypothetical protein
MMMTERKKRKKKTNGKIGNKSFFLLKRNLYIS